MDPVPPGLDLPQGRRRPSALRVVVLVLAAVGLSCLGWLGYQYLGTNLVAQRRFSAERSDLRDRWAAGTAPPGLVPGQPIALLRIPRFGAGFEVPVVEGTSLDDLSRGVGHYAGTAAPGAVGNFAVAGHRVTHGQPFAQLLRLGKGDEVVVETATATYTYVLDTAPGDLTVADTAGWVLEPVPGQLGARATRALITLTTGQDLVRSRDRSVAFGHLASTRNK